MGDPVDVREEVRCRGILFFGSSFCETPFFLDVALPLYRLCLLCVSMRLFFGGLRVLFLEGFFSAPRSPQMEESCKPQCVKALLAYQVCLDVRPVLRFRCR